jgi:hypothetical protein
MRYSCLSVRLAVRMEQLGTHCKDFDEILYLIFFFNLSRTFKLHQNLTRITNALYEDVFTFMAISCCMSEIKVVEKIENTFYV